MLHISGLSVYHRRVRDAYNTDFKEHFFKKIRSVTHGKRLPSVRNFSFGFKIMRISSRNYYFINNSWKYNFYSPVFLYGFKQLYETVYSSFRTHTTWIYAKIVHSIMIWKLWKRRHHYCYIFRKVVLLLNPIPL